MVKYFFTAMCLIPGHIRFLFGLHVSLWGCLRLGWSCIWVNTVTSSVNTADIRQCTPIPKRVEGLEQA